MMRISRAARKAEERKGRVRWWLHRLFFLIVVLTGPGLFAVGAGAVSGGGFPVSLAWTAAASAFVMHSLLINMFRASPQPQKEEAPVPAGNASAAVWTQPGPGRLVVIPLRAREGMLVGPAGFVEGGKPSQVIVAPLIIGAGTPSTIRQSRGSVAALFGNDGGIFFPAAGPAVTVEEAEADRAEAGSGSASPDDTAAVVAAVTGKGTADEPVEKQPSRSDTAAEQRSKEDTAEERWSKEETAAEQRAKVVPAAPAPSPEAFMKSVAAARAAGDAPLPAARPDAGKPRKRLGRLARRHTILGVDVGGYSTKVIQLRRGRGGNVVVMNFWLLRTPSGVLAGGKLVKPHTLAARLGELVGGYRLAGRPAVTALAEEKAFTKVVRFPRMSHEEVANALKWEAENYLPMPLDDAALDFLVGRHPPSEAGGDGEQGDEQGGDMEVLLVAAPREAVAPFGDALREARLRPVAVEIESLACFRALTALGMVPPVEQGLTVMFDMGHETTRLTVFRNDLPVVSRSVKPGGRDFTEAIARGLNFPAEKADAAKRRWGIREGTPVEPLVAGLVEELLEQMWRSLEYYLVLSRVGVVDRILLFGGNALLPGLYPRIETHIIGRLRERFDREPEERLVRLVDPAKGVRSARHLRKVSGELNARFVGALGLGLWKG